MKRLVAFALFIWIEATPAWPQVSFVSLPRKVVEARLKTTKMRNNERQSELRTLFQDVGCSERLSEQEVKGSKLGNLVCVLPGLSDEIIVVGAHFDQVDAGKGIVDNWSGAALLPSLYESLKGEPRKHTFIFIGFTDEEKGLVGSRYYAGHLSKEAVSKIEAMVNMDTLGLSTTKVWVSHADKNLVTAVGLVAHGMSLPIQGVNVEKIGSTDSESFAARKIPSITIHSLTQETLPILHSQKDDINAIKIDDYYDTYRLIAAYLAYLDKTLVPRT